MSAIFSASGPLAGSVSVPADKSISHRAALMAAMSDRPVAISNFLESGDTRSTLAAISAIGARVEGPDGAQIAMGAPIPNQIIVHGVGLRGARPATVDAGNAGTLIRLLPGWLAAQPEGRRWTLDGDSSLRSRPMDRIAGPLREMGARITCSDGERAPIIVESAPLRGVNYESPVASAQVKSCVLLAGLLAGSATTVSEPRPSRDHTERMLEAAGATVAVDGATVRIEPADALQLPDLRVPGDISSAAFFLVAATLTPGSDITLEGVGVNRTRTGLIDILGRMGARIEIEKDAVVGGEPVADLRVRSADLVGTSIGGDEIPRAIDELPIVALAAAAAKGRTEIRNAAELRRKESDRVDTVARALRAIGISVEEHDDGMTIEGTGGVDGWEPAVIDAAGDHRIAMFGAIAGIVSSSEVTVEGMGVAAVSYPGFERDLDRLRR